MASAFADIPEDPFDAPDEPWFIEPKDRGPADEFARQSRFVAYMRKHARGVMVWAVPNGGKSTDWQRLRKQKEGVVAGVPDLIILWNRGEFFPEFKDGQKMPTRDQRGVLNSLYRQHRRCGVYRRPETLVAHLRAAGCPVGGPW